MNTFKTNKGITLVALIITIIVLLILTVVAISSITDQGLFTKSQEAVNKYEESREEEEGKLAGYASEIDKYLQKDRVYIIEDTYLKITKDKKLEVGDSTGSVESIPFEYVSVTEEILTIVKGYGGTVPDNVSDYSSALEIQNGGDKFYILLSKDKQILYFAGEECFLEEEIKTGIYNVNLLGNDMYVILMKNGIAHIFNGGSKIKSGNYEIKSGVCYTTTGIEIGTYRNFLYIDGENADVRFAGYGNKIYVLLASGIEGDWIEGRLLDESEKTLADFGLSE